MPTVTYIQPDGTAHRVDVPVGVSLMKAAVSNDVAGIVGECGGSAVCATCHVYVENTTSPLGEPSGDEDEMLDWTATPRQTNSRLSCQVVPLVAECELTVRVPEAQV
ncbi:2Fe-2S ferredoxin [Rhodococcus erythropolis]|uniref:2Fe-2S iron-sulfur cluster-binding protein n=1 Tax=Rhodococcus erythropolis TaxID=1833 RepID=UPI002168586F|nr:2Fe-2S iron-sulfur cluster-binding protein [Rhodococcus erythropolis]MCS4253054.1 2Fe-2S ferredoxin [Rhodococcus erythropolis]MCW2428501.1 2Fe-2S ferredoxin [Rhodococcus erythropolis]